MRYCDLSGALTTYQSGGNVSEYLRHRFGESTNTESIIEIAYDLQAGSYVQHYHDHEPQLRRYIEEISGIITHYARFARTILDVGTGECTTLKGVSVCFPDTSRVLACDLSWSRLYVGRRFLDEGTSRVKLFAASLFTLPLQSKSIDLLWTSHALEPNGGREKEALTELFRVARKLCLFEPYYEANSTEGKLRMDRLGYIRDIPAVISSIGGVLEDCIPIRSVINPLNPTYAFIIATPDRTESNDLWACPATRYPLTERSGFYYCCNSGLAYPILCDIPVLRPGAAILATALANK